MRNHVEKRNSREQKHELPTLKGATGVRGYGRKQRMWHYGNQERSKVEDEGNKKQHEIAVMQ